MITFKEAAMAAKLTAIQIMCILLPGVCCAFSMVLLYYVVQRIYIDIIHKLCATYLCTLTRCVTCNKLLYYCKKEVLLLSEKKRKAKWQNDYIAKAYDRINLTVMKGQKDIIKAHAEERGESVNGFINRAIEETMARDKEG